MRGIKANLVFNVAGPIVSLVVALITTPIYVSHIGLARYGLLAIIWRLLGYFGFLDLGLSRASANALAKLRDSSSRGERAKVLVTAFWINLCLGIAGGIIFYFTGIFFIDHLLTVPADLRPEIETAFPWVACVLPLALVSGLGFGALESRERFLATNVLQVAGDDRGTSGAPFICRVHLAQLIGRRSRGRHIAWPVGLVVSRLCPTRREAIEPAKLRLEAMQGAA